MWGRGGGCVAHSPVTQGGHSDPVPAGQGRDDELCEGNEHEGQASSVPLRGWRLTETHGLEAQVMIVGPGASSEAASRAHEVSKEGHRPSRLPHT